MEKVGLKDENGKFYHGWLVLITGIVLVIFGYSCIITITGLFMLPVTESLGFSIGQFSTYISILSVTSIFSLLIFSRFMVEKYIKKIMIAAAVAGGSAFFGFANATALWHFYLFAVPMGFCFGCLTSTPCSVLINNWFGSKIKGITMGILFSTVTTMILINVMNQLVLNMGWRFTYNVIATCLFVVCIPCIIIFIKWSPQNLGTTRMGETQEDISAKAGEGGYTGVAFKEAVKHPLTWLFFFSGALIVLASSSILAHTVTFLTTCGYSAEMGGIIYSVMIGGLTVGNIIAGAITDRVNVKVSSLATFIGFLCALISGIFMPYAKWLIIFWVGGYALGGAGVTVTPPLIAKHMFGEKELGSFISYINIFISVGAAFGAMITGLLYDTFHSYAPAWLVMTIAVLASGIIRNICSNKKHMFKA